MNELHPEDFRQFFTELHGYPPFEWQQRLVNEIISGEWPDALKLPTGSGKTSIIEIVIFALACEAVKAPSERSVPRRLLYVVDRRIVVDEAFARANDLAEKLDDPPGPISIAVSENLKAISGEPKDGTALDCFALRGGLYRDSSWVQHPGRATIITGTVDQIGSRLLFRGYGVTPRMRPIHAGLFGNDSLIVLDEAHCSNPFSQTLGWIRHHRENIKSEIAIPPFRVIEMTATPAAKDAKIFELKNKESQDEYLKMRLEAPKVATLYHAEKASGKNEDMEFSKAVAPHLTKLIETGTKKILVVVNRVKTAKTIYESILGSSLSKEIEYKAELLTGRMRPYDRDKITERLQKEYHLKSNSKECYDGPPVIVVSTQSIEVGADFDFEALVSESASLDALRQRFGRLDRAGSLRGKAKAIIVGREASLKGADPDPVYGDSLRACWNWLQSKTGEDCTIDFGIAAFEKHLADEKIDLETLNSPKLNAPLLPRSFLKLLVQTNPEPALSPDVSLYLHGAERGTPEVYFCWRKDLPELPNPNDAKERDRSDVETQFQKLSQDRIDIVNALPPVSTELLSVPLWVAEKWLLGESLDGELGSDQLGESRDENTNFRRNYRVKFDRLPLRWRGAEDSEIIRTLREKKGKRLQNKLKPGDTLVLPLRAGGMSELGTIPEEFHHDIAEEATLLAKDKAALRLTRPILERILADCDEDLRDQLLAEWDEIQNERKREKFTDFFPLVENLSRVVEDGNQEIESLSEIIGFVNSKTKANTFPYPDGSGVILNSKNRIGKISRIPQPNLSLVEEGERTSTGEKPVTLSQHSKEVAQETRYLAELFGLPDEIVEALVIAAELHDSGKAEPRFQCVLNNGDAMGARLRPEPLAKSNAFGRNRKSSRKAWEESGLPSGFRHELISTALAHMALANRETENLDFILHEIASHHGYCRSLAPIILDGENIETTFSWNDRDVSISGDGSPAQISSGICDRFWLNVERFGFWGEAWLESILRLADQRCSSGIQKEVSKK